MSRLSRFIACCTLALGLGTAACSGTPIACRVTTVDYAAEADGFVTYNASVTGSATIKSVVYLGQNDSLTESDPTLPFEIQVPVPSGTSIGITAYGSIDSGAEGNVLVAYDFVSASGGNSYHANSACR